MTPGTRAALALLIGASVVSGATRAVDGDGPDRDEVFRAPSNLQVLPRGAAGPALHNLMKSFNQALGVHCDYCHAQDAKPGRLDFPSDENPKKAIARVMITMLDEINSKYVAQLGDPPYVEQATCGTCHRGQSDPPAFVAPAETHGSTP